MGTREWYRMQAATPGFRRFFLESGIAPRSTGLTRGMAHDLVRPRSGRVIAGVCAGLGRRFGLSPWLVRALFLASLLLPGPQAVIYLVLWILVPAERD